MVFENRYKNILKTKADLRQTYNNNICIKRDVVQKVNIKVVAHFGNCVWADLVFSNVCLLRGYNNTANIGYILRFLVDMFDCNNEDGADISSLEGVKVRLVFDDANPYNGRCVAIGHETKDIFVLLDDLVNLTY